jgi:glyoxylase-like metal-dependent hydrolase (beta-lactamase superfamily II)/8-oxo-dGTP pyrophosphatase MutT (NUDIX family)
MRRAAVVVPVCGDQALMIERASTLRFQPGFYSFPGGAIDEGDQGPERPGLGPPEARIAAWRELLEETGILAPGDYALSAEVMRQSLFKGSSAAELSQGCDWSAWRYLGCWTTPEYAHLRFETYFYSCRFEHRMEARTNTEIERCFWGAAGEIRSAWEAGELPASPPVLAALDAALDGLSCFNKTGDSRDLLSAGGAAYYLPLRAPTLPPASHTNCSFIGSDSYLYVVDPAAVEPSERDVLWQQIEARCAQGSQFAGVLLTHLHHDHIGAAAWLAEKTGRPILASKRTQVDLAAGRGSGVSAGDYELEDLPEVTKLLAEGDELPGGWAVLETPGHAAGHLCFWHAKTRVLIAGDMIASGSTILIEPDQGDMSLYLKSLTRLARLGPKLIIPAHGMPLAQGAKALHNLIEHRLKRETKVLSALQILGRASLSDLVKIAYDDTPEFLWPLAQLSLHSHLLKLSDEGYVSLTQDTLWTSKISSGG